ncbi:MAG: hypothetical protein V3R63_04480 [Alphaproteobacteria bacterium]
MSIGRHSYVPFYPSDWIGGTAGMSPQHEIVLFRVCLYIWDKAAPCPAKRLAVALGNVADWPRLVEELIDAEKLYRTPEGGLTNVRALAEAEKAYDLWRRKSEGGREGAAKSKRHKSAKTDAECGSPGGIPGGSPGGSGAGIPSQNQNRNHIENENHVGDPVGRRPSPPGRDGAGRARSHSRKSSAATRLPDEDTDPWPLPAIWAAFAAAHRPELDPAELAATFADYWRGVPGTKGVKRDWFATWRNWVRRERGREPASQAKADARRLQDRAVILDACGFGDRVPVAGRGGGGRPGSEINGVGQFGAEITGSENFGTENIAAGNNAAGNNAAGNNAAGNNAGGRGHAGREHGKRV